MREVPWSLVNIHLQVGVYAKFMLLLIIVEFEIEFSAHEKVDHTLERFNQIFMMCTASNRYK